MMKPDKPKTTTTPNDRDAAIQISQQDKAKKILEGAQQWSGSDAGTAELLAKICADLTSNKTAIRMSSKLLVRCLVLTASNQ